jgi:3-hydroxybutyryl-CoA dehydrogenase
MRILVIGAGTMGAGIAETAIQKGLSVWLTDALPDALPRATHRIRQNVVRAYDKGRLDEPVESVMARLEPVEEWPDGVDWVIEAVPEQLELKHDLFRALDARYGPEVWLASNTSSIAVTRLQAATPRYPERVAGLHFFNPVARMPLVEMIRGLDTRPEYLDAARELVARLGKTAIEAPDRPGFLVNRVARPYYLEALRMVDDDRLLSMEEVDAVFEGAGFPMGPFRLMDLVGIDVNFSVTKSVFDQTFGDPRYRPHPWQERLMLRGHLGRKTGRGFYRYE